MTTKMEVKSYQHEELLYLFQIAPPGGAVNHKSWKRDRIWTNSQNVQCPKTFFGGIWPTFSHKKQKGCL